MKTRSTQPRISMHRAGLLAGAMLAGLVLAPAPAMAQEGEFMRNLLGSIGVISPETPQIEYRERAPLVVPPSRDLPPPASAEALREDPRWPDDASERARRQAEAARLERFDRDMRSGTNQDVDRMTIEEIRSFRRAGARGTGDFEEHADSDSYRMTPDELRSFARDQSDAPQGLTRRYLTDPPAHFLRPAPTD
jgi:hypothetical protein